MKKRFTIIASAFAILAGGSSLLSHPAYAAGNDSSMDGCSITDIVNAANDACPGGGTVTNIQQNSDGCSFDITCS